MDGKRQSAAHIGRWGPILLAGLLSAAIHGNGALAANCAPSRSPEAARVQRQIAANRAFEVKYGCAAASSFACREIAGRIAQANARLASLSAVPGGKCDKPVVAKRAPVRRKAASTVNAVVEPAVSAAMETRCVRLSDGYYFPTPNSGYSKSADMQTIVAQCRFICDDPGMDVYRMAGSQHDADEMTSVTTGARYADLANAGAYRAAPSLKTCDMNRFYKTVLAKAPDGNIAEDRTEPQESASRPEAAAAVVLFADAGLRGTTSIVPAAVRKVRVVGAAFLPEQ